MAAEGPERSVGKADGPRSLRLVEHPERPAILDELHARPFTPLQTPRRILHYGYLIPAGGAPADLRNLSAWPGFQARPEPGFDGKFIRLPFSGGAFRWERHNEFITHTWDFGGETAAGAPHANLRPADPDACGDIAQPGPLIVAVDLHLLAAEDLDEAAREALSAGGATTSSLEGGDALVSSSFRSDADGYVRIVVVNSAMDADGVGALVQRVLEIETYRCLALLGLPVAQSRLEPIERAEAELPDLLARLCESGDAQDSRHLLNRISQLSADVEAGGAAIAFRVAATRAYHEIVQLRLQSLNEDPGAKRCTWAGFLSRRLDPAVRTCIVIEERQRRLSSRLQSAAQLLTTRIELAMQSQNQQILSSLSERARLQLSLQHTVEKLSVFAITYYAAGLFHLLALAVKSRVPGLDAELLTGLAIVPIAAVLMLGLRAVRRAHAERESS